MPRRKTPKSNPTGEVTVRIPTTDDHPRQKEFVYDKVKRKVVKAGRRSGKTVGVSILAVEAFLHGHRILYATPTAEQINRFWMEVKWALADPIAQGVFVKNESETFIEKPGTEQRIKAKTAWNADTLRGDYADVLILDEFQLMNEDAWGVVGAPMMIDTDGDAIFCFTPPSIKTRSVSKATDKKHANKLWKRAKADTSGRWKAYHFTSHDNPHISQSALNDLINSHDMTTLAIKQEILAEDVDEIPGALWTYDVIEACRVTEYPPLFRIGVGVDPHSTSGRTGIIAAGIGMFEGEIHGYLLADKTRGGKPEQWAKEVVGTYNTHDADVAIGEINHGGDMIEAVIRGVDGGGAINYQTVRASRGKYVRAEPVSALYGTPPDGDSLGRILKPRIHHVGYFPELEEQMVTWVPGDVESPNNMDAMVWIMSYLMIKSKDPSWEGFQSLGHVAGYKPLGADDEPNPFADFRTIP